MLNQQIEHFPWAQFRL